MRLRSRSIGFSAASTLLLAITPKCPLCWMALVGTIGVSWPVSSGWLRSFAIALLLMQLGLLLFGAHRSHDYRPFLLGVGAAVALYVCKFHLELDAGVYLNGATLFGATLWTAKLIPHRTSEVICDCYPPEFHGDTASGCASMSSTSTEVLDG
jgi:hypothetical protein